MAKKQSLDEMRDEAYRRQDNLAADIDELVDRVNPKNAVNRWKNELVGSVKSFSDAGDGKTPATPVAVAGGVIGVIVLAAGVAATLALRGGKDSADSRRSARTKRARGARKT